MALARRPGPGDRPRGLGLLVVRRPSERLLDVLLGAMVYVVIDEMLPESRENGHEREATGGVVVGFAAMMVLDNVFG